MAANVHNLLTESITSQTPYVELATQLKRVVSSHDYENRLLDHSIMNQVAFDNCGSDIKRMQSEKEYYEKLMAVHRRRMLVYPYKFEIHILNFTGVLPFSYYRGILLDMIQQEKSYDTLPNFTAVDCLRLTGVGRNQFIDIMNNVRSKKIQKSKILKILPSGMPSTITLEPWWTVRVIASVEKLKECTAQELEMIEQMAGTEVKNPNSPSASALTSNFMKLASSATTHLPLMGMGKKATALKEPVLNASAMAATLPRSLVLSLHQKGILYPQVDVADADLTVVPPLNNFVMNRASTSPFEKLLYDILVSIDERTTVRQLASVLDRDINDIRNAVGIYCRLGMAYKKTAIPILQELAAKGTFHESWSDALCTMMQQTEEAERAAGGSAAPLLPNEVPKKRIAFLFDYELTAYLMMGNLGELKDHAVTLFEAGKMTDEMLSRLVEQLLKIDSEGKEGEVKKYFDHAVALREILLHLRHNSTLDLKDCDGKLDMVRSESLNSLDSSTKRRILDKNYSCVFSMSPLGCPLTLPSCMPNYFGNPIALVASPWFRLFISAESHSGSELVVLRRGLYLNSLPECLSKERGVINIIMFAWSLDAHPVHLATSNALFRINEELQWQPVMLIPYERTGGSLYTTSMPFPHGEYKTEAEAGAVEAAPAGPTKGEADLSELFGDEQESKPQPPTAEHVDPTPPLSATDTLIASETDKIMSRFVEDFGLQHSVGHITLLIEKRKKKGSLPANPKRLELNEKRKKELAALRTKFKSNHETPGVEHPEEEEVATENPSEEEEQFDVKVTPHGVSFGIPVSDPKLTASVLTQLNKHHLLCKASMEKHTLAMQKLTIRFISFVHDQLDGGQPMMHEVKVQKSPLCQRQMSAVPYPKRSLYFNGKDIVPLDV
eukprot:TRINITY_DN472_c2_g1_i1.p1 TRINITY_DN472_c2_g1~~TRINITY_DN472_c2_g1_i1.p1  ORF type:complete len:924 (+),score=149.23 TRINITY_DN472_c2_g1_i1:92-2773(+)